MSSPHHFRTQSPPGSPPSTSESTTTTTDRLITGLVHGFDQCAKDRCIISQLSGFGGDSPLRFSITDGDDQQDPKQKSTSAASQRSPYQCSKIVSKSTTNSHYHRVKFTKHAGARRELIEESRTTTTIRERKVESVYAELKAQFDRLPSVTAVGNRRNLEALTDLVVRCAAMTRSLEHFDLAADRLFRLAIGKLPVALQESFWNECQQQQQQEEEDGWNCLLAGFLRRQLGQM